MANVSIGILHAALNARRLELQYRAYPPEDSGGTIPEDFRAKELSQPEHVSPELFEALLSAI